MNIVLASEFYYPHLGGITEHVHHLAQYAARAGHRVRVVTSQPHGAQTVSAVDLPYEVVRLGRGLPIPSNGATSRITVGLGLQTRMDSLVEGADVVHVHSPLFPMLPFFALKSARRLGVPTVATNHTHFGPGDASRLLFWRPVLLAYMHAIDHPIAVSESAALCARPFLRTPCTLIPNGVDTARWASGRRRAEFDDNMLGIVFLGRIDDRNDVDVLLSAFTQVAHARDDVRLILVGDGPRRAPLEAKVPSHLRSRVIWTGAKTDVSERADLLACADVMAFTARVVSHPTALVEGMAAGVPVVAYDIEGVRELIADGCEGFRIAPGDADALARRLLDLLDDKASRERMARNARARAASFDWSIVGERILEVYRQAASGPVRHAEPHDLSPMDGKDHLRNWRFWPSSLGGGKGARGAKVAAVVGGVATVLGNGILLPPRRPAEAGSLDLIKGNHCLRASNKTSA
jgi:phosphatidyl-myo-inositol alpha-mannosyltransferase